ncbi:protein POLYCHOME-like, partial [Ananas comosus]|uniref:Protein POLYCHOME-like n=1 Tax=Ananas comosus TaxID=4615 RepID=A0A6P5GWC4_ANACO
YSCQNTIDQKKKKKRAHFRNLKFQPRRAAEIRSASDRNPHFPISLSPFLESLHRPSPPFSLALSRGPFPLLFLPPSRSLCVDAGTLTLEDEDEDEVDEEEEEERLGADAGDEGVDGARERSGRGGGALRRVTSPGALAAAAARRRHLLRDLATEGKENMPPWAARSRTRRSPLPKWYPRTPLRDITAIVRAIERRDRGRRRATAAQQRTREGVEVSPSPDTTSSPQEPSASNEDTAPIHTVAPSDVSNTASLTSPTEGLNSSPSPTPLSLPTSEPSLQTQSASNDPSPAVNEKLSSLIDEMQRLVMENLRRAPQAAQPCEKKSTTATQRSRVLKSMR